MDLNFCFVSMTYAIWRCSQLEHRHNCTKALAEQEVWKPVKVAAPRKQFMVRTQQTANKQRSAGVFMNTNFTTTSSRLPHERAGKCLINRNSWPGRDCCFSKITNCRQPEITCFNPQYRYVIDNTTLWECWRKWWPYRQRTAVWVESGGDGEKGRGNNGLNQWSPEPDISGTYRSLLCQALTSLLRLCMSLCSVYVI